MTQLERFRSAQNAALAGFDAALAEIRAGGKRGHWIWYVFPQLAGLGSSSTSQFYGLDGEAEAAAFLRDDELRARLLTITTAVRDQLRAHAGLSLRTLMGSETDARKLVSSLTLFGWMAGKLHDPEMADASQDVLSIAAAQGYPACAYTLGRLEAR